MVNSVKIGGIEYDVLLVPNLKEDGEALNGNIKYNDQEICINENLERDQRSVTLLHEIFHAILIKSGWKHNERMIEMLSYNMFEVIKDNHKILLEYILKEEDEQV